MLLLERSNCAKDKETQLRQGKSQGTGRELMGWTPYRRQRPIVADERRDHYGRGFTETLLREVERLDWLRALELLYGERVATWVEAHLYTWTAKVLVQCMVHQRAGLQRTSVTDGMTKISAARSLASPGPRP